MKKPSGDIIILHMFTKNYGRMVYGSWDMVHDRCNCYFSFWFIFCLLCPNSPKNQNFDKMKKAHGDIIILHMCTKNYDQVMYGSWDMVRDRCNCYFWFWAIFCLFTPLTAQKIKILKKWKKCMEISSFYICVSKIMIRWWMDKRMDEQTNGRTDWWMDGQTDGWMDRPMDGWTDGQTDGRMDRQMDGRMDRRTDRRTDEQTDRKSDI